MTTIQIIKLLMTDEVTLVTERLVQRCTLKTAILEAVRFVCEKCPFWGVPVGPDRYSCMLGSVRAETLR